MGLLGWLLGSGSTKSSAVVNDVVNEMLNVISSTSQSIIQSTNCENIADLTNCNLSNVTIDQACDSSAVFTAVQNASQSTDVDQQLDQVIKNKMETTTTDFQLNDVAQNAVTNSMTNLKTAIKNTISQSCDASSNSSNVFTCGGSTLINSTIGQSACQTIVSSCTQNSSQVTDAKQELQQTLDQYSKLTVKDTIIGILIAIAVIIALVEFAPLIFRLFSKKNPGGSNSTFSLDPKMNPEKSDSLRNIVILLIIFFIFNLMGYLDCALNKSVLGIFCKPGKESNFKNRMVILDIIIIVIVVLIFLFKVLIKKYGETKNN